MKDRALRTIDRHPAIDPLRRLRCASPPPPPFGAEDCGCAPGAFGFTARRKPKAPRVCHASQERLNKATAARPPWGEDGARSASEGGGCVSAMSSDSKRPKKQRPANAQGPPPSAPLRFAATSPLRGGGLWLRSRGVWVHGATQARSASGLPCKPEALRICHASQERLNKATAARPPRSEERRGGETEGARCVSAMSSDSKRPKKQRPANAQRPPPSAALRFAATSPLRGGGLWLRSRGVWVHGATQARSAADLPCKPEALRICHASQERLNKATAARPPLGEDVARSATEGGGCVSAMSSDSKRPKKQRPANAQRPPPSAALRFAATSPLRGGGLWLRSRGVWVHGATQARSASGLPCKPGALRICHASQKRLNEATVARPPLGEDGARSASEGGGCVGNAPPKNDQRVPSHPHS